MLDKEVLKELLKEMLVDGEITLEVSTTGNHINQLSVKVHVLIDGEYVAVSE